MNASPQDFSGSSVSDIMFALCSEWPVCASMNGVLLRIFGVLTNMEQYTSPSLSDSLSGVKIILLLTNKSIIIVERYIGISVEGG